MALHFIIALSIGLASPGEAGDVLAEPGMPHPAKCPVAVVYADKRPYESPSSDPFFAVSLETRPGGPFGSRESRVLIRTDSALWEFSAKGYDAEFTLPTNERVVSAWADQVRDPQGRMLECSPSGAFFADGYNGIPFTKRQRIEEKGARLSIESATQKDVAFGIKVRNPGRRPAGRQVSVPTSCAEPDHDARRMTELPRVDADEPHRGAVVVDVGPTGDVMTIDILESTGSRKADDALLADARRSAFEPAVWKCTPIPSRIVLRRE